MFNLQSSIAKLRCAQGMGEAVGEGWGEAFRLISFARLCNGASALYFLVYE